MGPHEPIGDGYTAGHPDGNTVDRPTLPFRGLADAEVIAEARRIYNALQTTPRCANDRDPLLVAWGAVCMEMTGVSSPTTSRGRPPTFRRDGT